MEKRRVLSVEERLSGCMICGFPLVHKHHILPFATWSETNITMHLCPNCHELIHIAINAIIFKKKRSEELWELFCERVGKNNPLILLIEEKVYEWMETNFELTIKYYDC